jgi:hypothetical protein
MKYCRLCTKTKPLDDFPNNKIVKDGKNTYCRPCDAERMQTWRNNNREQVRVKDWEKHILRKYSLTPEEYHYIIDKQGGGCGICGVESEMVDRRLSIDHDHKTGAVRGVLCSSCNRALERLETVPAWTILAEQYLAASTKLLGV